MWNKFKLNNCQLKIYKAKTLTVEIKMTKSLTIHSVQIYHQGVFVNLIGINIINGDTQPPTDM